MRNLKSIQLGCSPTSVKELEKALSDNRFEISEWGNEILNSPNFVLSTIPTEINLVAATVMELGLHKGGTFKEILSHAANMGLDICPAEVGPRLRLQYVDQIEGETLIIAMEPVIFSSSQLPFVFDVLCCHGKRSLGASMANFFPSSKHHSLVFMRSK